MVTVIEKFTVGEVGTIMTANAEWRKRPADERFATLDDLHRAVQSRAWRSHEVKTEVKDLAIDLTPDKNGIYVQAGGRQSAGLPVAAVLGHWSMGQLCQQLRAPADFLRRMPADLAVRALREAVAQAKNKRGKLLTVARMDESDHDLQAWTGPKYGRIWDVQVVQLMRDLVEESGGAFFNPKDWSGKPSGLYASHHDVWGFLINGGAVVDLGWRRDRKDQRDILYRGIIISNSETGARKFSYKTFYFREVCGNFIIHNAGDLYEVDIRHTAGASGRFRDEVIPQLHDYVQRHLAASTADDVALFTRAKALRLPAEDGEILGLFAGDRFGLSQAEVKAAILRAREEEGACDNVYDLVQGLTATARDLAFADARVDRERRAGALLALESFN